MLEERERTGRFHGEVMLRRADGTTFQADVRMNGFVDRRGAKRTAMIIRDVGEQKRLEAQVRLQAAALHAALVRERGDLASRVVFITGDMFSAATHAFLASTGRPLISKPFSEADVWNAVAAVAG